MMDFIQFHYVEFVAAHVYVEHKLHIARPVQDLAATSITCISSISSRQTGPLECSDNCTCRCHARSLSPLIPQSLAPYVGQLFISKQLLHPAFTPWNCCNVVTCRGTYLKPAKVAYTFPQWSLLHGSFQTSSFETIHLSLNAYRTVPYSSPILEAIFDADVHGVRDLFAKQQASIWDVDINGDSIFWYACDRWQDAPTEDGLEIVRFLVEAGADALLYAESVEQYPFAFLILEWLTPVCL
ncbi:hypothetical protein BC629DRAFT_1497477 [Irpex lacteus]|nr:hypothetical protein BC629DRAFT_1497477 [Irpex lacteus]